MKKKWLFLKATAVLLILLLAISGSSSGGKKSSGDGDKVELTMAAWGNPAEIKVYQKGLTEYEKQNPNVSIKLIPVPGCEL